MYWPHRRSQDFVCGWTFFLKMLMTFLSSSSSITQAKTAKLTSNSAPPSKNFLKNFTSYSAWGWTYNFPLQITSPPPFFRPGGAPAPRAYDWPVWLSVAHSSQAGNHKFTWGKLGCYLLITFLPLLLRLFLPFLLSLLSTSKWPSNPS